MDLDFTVDKYKELCEAISKSKYVTLRMQDFFSLDAKPDRYVLLRHDIDRNVNAALKFAELENSLGLVATYYFRYTKHIFKPEIIKHIADFGHEIGYHYEVFDKAKGKHDFAINLFEKELNEFKKIIDIKTICMHGNPLSKYNNLNLWKKYNFRDFGILGEPYLSLDYNGVYYFTDTGRGWNRLNVSIKDIVVGIQLKIKNTDELIALVKKEKLNQICILTHPERWSDNLFQWILGLSCQNIKNIAKILLKWNFMRKY